MLVHSLANLLPTSKFDIVENSFSLSYTLIVFIDVYYPSVFQFVLFHFDLSNTFDLIQLISPDCRIYIRWWPRSALVQVMACRLLGVKPLLEPMLTYYQLDLQEHTSVKLESKHKKFPFIKIQLKMSSAKWRPFCPGGGGGGGGDEFSTLSFHFS